MIDSPGKLDQLIRCSSIKLTKPCANCGAIDYEQAILGEIHDRGLQHHLVCDKCPPELAENVASFFKALLRQKTA